MNIRLRQQAVVITAIVIAFSFQPPADKWESKFVGVSASGSLQYRPDDKGNTIPDFSRVGYYQGDQPIPDVPVVKTISPSDTNSQKVIQAAIDEVSRLKPDQNGFRGAILLKKAFTKFPAPFTSLPAVLYCGVKAMASRTPGLLPPGTSNAPCLILKDRAGWKKCPAPALLSQMPMCLWALLLFTLNRPGN